MESGSSDEEQKSQTKVNAVISSFHRNNIHSYEAQSVGECKFCSLLAYGNIVGQCLHLIYDGSDSEVLYKCQIGPESGQPHLTWQKMWLGSDIAQIYQHSYYTSWARCAQKPCYSLFFVHVSETAYSIIPQTTENNQLEDPCRSTDRIYLDFFEH